MDIGDQTLLASSASSASSPKDAAPPKRGDTIGRYLVLEVLGAGGMGVVVAAYDPDLDRKVAVKVLAPADGVPSKSGPSGPSTSGTRLMREAQALASLRHPNVVTVHDVGHHEDHLFIAMEYVEGLTLERWMKNGPPPWRDALDVLLPAGRGLAAAHDAGLVHRDFKPANVMLEGSSEAIERVLVLDFGLARRAGTATISPSKVSSSSGLSNSFDAELTAAGAVLGTPAYMAPEQHSGSDVDERTDQHSFCAVVFEALYGIRPYAGQNLLELAANRIKGKVRPPPRGVRVPKWLHEVLVRGLAADAKDRWPTMHALLAALANDPRPRRRRWLVAGGATTSLAAVAGSIAWSENRRVATCHDEANQIDEIWDSSVAKRGRDSFDATGLPMAEETWSRLSPRIDEFAATWRAARLEVCLATGNSDDRAQSVRRISCLEDRRVALAEVITLFTEADRPTVGRAFSIFLGEPTLDDCADDAYLARTHRDASVAVREQGRTLRAQVRRGRRLRKRGEHTEALDLLTGIAQEAHDLELATIETDALRQMALSHNAQGLHEKAAEALEAAFFRSREHGDALGALTASLQLITTTGDLLSRPKDGERWARHAELLLSELGGERHMQRARLLQRTARVEARKGDFEEAREHAAAALDLATAEFGDQSVLVSQILMVLSSIYLNLHDVDRAVSTARRSLDIYERIVGPDHPDLAPQHQSLGVSLLEHGDLAEARKHMRHVVALAELGEGTLMPELGTAMHNLGLVSYLEKDLEQALQWYEKAAQLRQERPNATLGDTLINLSGLYSDLGRADDATRTMHQARAVLEETRGPRHPLVAAALFNIGNQAYADGDLDLAYEMHAKALEIRREHYPAAHPWLQQSRTYVAIVALRQERFGLAAELAREAMDLADENTKPILNLQMRSVYASARIARDDPEAAATALRTVVTLGAVAPDAEYRRAQRLLAAAEFELDRDAPAARTFVQRLVETIRDEPNADPEELREAENWLRDHP